MLQAVIRTDFEDAYLKLHRVARNEKNWRWRFLKQVGEKGADMMREAIDDQLTYGRDTGAWPVSGALRDSISSFDLRQTGIRVGSRGVIYATVHEFGKMIRPVVAPKLVFYVFNTKYVQDSVWIPPRPFVRPVFYGPELRFDAVDEVAASLYDYWHRGKV